MASLPNSITNTQITSTASHDDNHSSLQTQTPSWGGRGKGGRGISRQTHQPGDINVENMSLDYDGKCLLKGASLKFRNSRCYGLVARNGSGKSTLLKAMDRKAIPGFPTALTSILIPQEVLPSPLTCEEMMLMFDGRLVTLEALLEAEEDPNEIELICEKLEALESENNTLDFRIDEALSTFNVLPFKHSKSDTLSAGQRKRVALASLLLHTHSRSLNSSNSSNPSNSRVNVDVVFLDEPSNYLDLPSISILKRVITDLVGNGCCVIIVTHDRDLLDFVATDIVHQHEQSLAYYKGNYNDFLGARAQNDTFKLRQAKTLNRQRTDMIQSMNGMKIQASKEGSRGGARAAQVASRKKKLERHGIEKDANGHRFTAQSNNSGIRPGSLNSLDTSTRTQTDPSVLLRRNDVSLYPIPDKMVQFNFRQALYGNFYEPLVQVRDVAWGVEGGEEKLFGFVELSIVQGSTTVIVGENSVGKSQLLKIIAGEMQPDEGEVKFATNVTLAHFHSAEADDLLLTCTPLDTPLSKFAELFPKLTDHEMRSLLADFGIGGSSVNLKLQLMSGGERTRVALALMMATNPHVLLLDEPNANLDIESTSALGLGLKDWGGAVVLLSHDSNLVKLLIEDDYNSIPRGGFTTGKEEGKDEGDNVQTFGFIEVEEKIKERFPVKFKRFVKRVEFEKYMEYVTVDLEVGCRNRKKL